MRWWHATQLYSANSGHDSFRFARSAVRRHAASACATARPATPGLEVGGLFLLIQWRGSMSWYVAKSKFSRGWPAAIMSWFMSRSGNPFPSGRATIQPAHAGRLAQVVQLRHAARFVAYGPSLPPPVCGPSQPLALP